MHCWLCVSLGFAFVFACSEVVLFLSFWIFVPRVAFLLFLLFLLSQLAVLFLRATWVGVLCVTFSIYES